MSNLFQRRYYQSDELRASGFKAVGQNVQIHQDCNIFGVENIALGDNVRIDAYVSIIGSGPVEIGSFVHIGSYCHLMGGEGIRIGDFCGLSQGVKLYSRSDDYSGEHLTNPCVPAEYKRVERGAIVLERHVVIGAGSVVLPGVTIGEGAAIGALSLASQSLRGWGVYFGAPVKRLWDRSQRVLELEQRVLASRPEAA